MYCPSCGASNIDYGAFCSSCGRPMAATKAGGQTLSSLAAQTGQRRAERQRVAAWVVVAALAGLVPVIFMLGAVAIPAYQDYTVRAQVSEGLALAAPLKTAVVAAWQAAGHDFASIDTDSIGRELEKHSKYVDSVAVVSGAIVITYGMAAYTELQTRTLTLVPALDAAARSVEWQCGRGTAPAGFEPIFEAPARFTDVPDELLPSGCRAQ